MQKHSGFTMVELMITLAILGIALWVAVPTYSDVRNKRAVTNAAEQINSLLSVARSESIRRNTTVTVTVNRTLTNWCVGMADNTTAACDCFDPTAGNYCKLDDIDSASTADDTVHILNGNDFELVGLPLVYGEGNAQFTPLRMVFDPVRGLLVSPGQLASRIQLTSTDNQYSLRVDTRMTGRLDICTISNKKVPGFTTCS